MNITMSPINECPRSFDEIESLEAPHDHPAPQVESDARRKVKITLLDLQKHGFGGHCPR